MDTTNIEDNRRRIGQFRDTNEAEVGGVWYVRESPPTDTLREADVGL
jgi:hypothetical protein